MFLCILHAEECDIGKQVIVTCVDRIVIVMC